MANAIVTDNEPVYYDPYRVEITKNPYPVFKRLREESPLYYNEEFDFYAVSHYDDVKRGLSEHETFINGRGGILELMKANVEMPAGTFIFEDPPQHTVHRNIVARLFTPRRMNGLEGLVRQFTCQTLDKLIDSKEFDFIADVGAQIPMQVISMLLGIPEEDQQAVRQRTDSKMRTKEAGKPLDYEAGFTLGEGFEEYIDWRIDNPSDDVMTELLQVEFTDEKGVDRRLSREELLTFCNVLAGAGNETTNRLIGWSAKTLAEHPDQRRKLVEDPQLIPDAIEEILRFEPPAPHVGRWIDRDTEFQGQNVKGGTPLLCLIGAANRDQSRFPDGDRFDILRNRQVPHLTFSTGIHTCIGNVLARMEGRIVLEELLKRIPAWEIDMDAAELIQTSTVRGWETLPAYIGDKPVRKTRVEKAVSSAAPESVDGEWKVTVKGPTGAMVTTLKLHTVDDKLTGTQTGEGVTSEIEDAAYKDGQISWTNKVTKPIKITSQFSGEVDDKTMSGKVKAGFMGKFPFTGEKV